ncbi:hypothetical protein PUN28_004594 [Cardiocondyla obscurior]
MADDIETDYKDSYNTATLVSSLCFVECKTEPESYVDLDNSSDKDLAEFDKSTKIQISYPVSIPMLKNPIVLLERCDKIWETLKLIKTIQPAAANVIDDIKIKKKKEEEEKEEVKEKKENEEKEHCLDKVKQSLSHVKIQPRRGYNKSLPFKFSIQRTQKLYPCVTCDKQYLERRSLRKHSERVHGVILPLLKRRKWRRTVLHKNKDNPFASFNKENNDIEKLNNDKDSLKKIDTKAKPISTITSPTTMIQFVTCTLCQQKVMCLRKHLINYHKIGGSPSVVEQLESSLLNETSSKNEKTASTDKPEKDGCLIMDSEGNTRGKYRVKRKKNYTLSQTNAKKKPKLNNEPNSFPSHSTMHNQQIVTYNKYKCDICLGMYATPHSLYKHKRFHKLRGETKNNFHKRKCNYFNSPFNKNYKILMESKYSRMSVNTVAKNSNGNTFNSTTKTDRTIRYNERMKKNNETTCICGRSFRNPHTLFVHKKHCELCQSDNTITKSTRGSSDRDSGIGINITIKKRNDSYEIVDKDGDNKLQVFESSSSPENSLPHTPNFTKDYSKIFTTQQTLDVCKSSKYSKDHSILKLQDTDEDVIIDIEEDTQITSNENNITKEIITRTNKKDMKKQLNNTLIDEKTEKVFNKVITLKQMCREVLEALDMDKSENISQNKNKERSRIKDREMCKENSQVENQKLLIHEENKRNLRSKRYSTVRLDYFYNETNIDVIQFDPTKCGYCEESLNMINSNDVHQCTVKEGKSFDNFSLNLLCFYCKDELNSYNDFDTHIRIQHFNQHYQCYYCPDRFTIDKARLDHFRKKHNDLVCRLCNKKVSISAKPYHEAYHLGYGFPCHKCKKTYAHNRNLAYHKHTVHSSRADNLTTCSICLKCVKFKTFRKHVAMHKRNVCYFCSKTFVDKIGLEYHTMIHHGTNVKLKCNICGTRFHTKKQLEVHEKIDGCNNGMYKMKKKNYNKTRRG